ncbi:uncharacterized mitochondrial protein AtMg00810-like [Miscanthus floridulus]|uniref:uncharacterized mitochondrial protein AtMg00810-like n=1 Tax=Miscanthus floridulus TaxID=154761 RepID=UPI0034594EDE
MAFLLLYIEDMVLSASTEALLQDIFTRLQSEFTVKDMGPLRYFLGVDAGMTNCKPALTPMNTKAKLPATTGVAVCDPSEYRSIAGALQYLTITRPDITYAGTGIHKITAYSDADWAGCPDTHRSTSGYCIYLGDALVSWSSKRQATVSRSSTEAEYRAVANAVAEYIWLWQLLHELHCDVPTVAYCDNVSTVYMSKNPVRHR